MNSAGASIVSYVQYLTDTQPAELRMHSDALDPMMLTASMARLSDPEYIRHDPFHAALAQRDIRVLDHLRGLYPTMDWADEEELRALDNKVAEVKLRIIDHDRVSRCSRLSRRIGL